MFVHISRKNTCKLTEPFYEAQLQYSKFKIGNQEKHKVNVWRITRILKFDLVVLAQ